MKIQLACRQCLKSMEIRQAFTKNAVGILDAQRKEDKTGPALKGLKVKTETIQIISGKSDTNHQQKNTKQNKTKRRANIQHNRNKVGKIALTPTQNPEAIKEKKNVTTTNSNFYRIKNQQFLCPSADYNTEREKKHQYHNVSWDIPSKKHARNSTTIRLTEG